MNAPLVSVSGLCVAVGDAPIVSDISFDVQRGQVLALIGESGSGKSTIALALMGWCRHGGRIAGGTIRVGGMAINSKTEAELSAIRGRHIAYIAQSAAAAFNPSRRIMAQVIEPALVHRIMTREAAEAKAIELFRALALPSPETLGGRYPHQVSGGQLQRLMAAMALITDPELVILDEPTTALDVTTQVEVLKCFKAALAHTGRGAGAGATAIYVSHDLAVVAQMADHIAVLRKGQMVEQGPADQVLNAPREAYTRSLMGALRPAYATPQPAAATPVLSVRNIVAGYGPLRNGVPANAVLRDVSFDLAAGGSLGIIGESGSGKSTLARVIAGLLPAASGDVRLDGHPLPAGLAGRTSDQFRAVQLVFQNADTALNPAHTLRRILARPLAHYHGLSGPAADARVADLLDLTQLPAALIDRPIRTLSGGQKQRVNLARALAANPKVLLCDEVTSALDTVVGAAILALIEDLRRQLGLATVFISHDIHAVAALCDQVLVLYGGTPVELASHAAFNGGRHHPYTDRLLSSLPTMQRGWLEATCAPKATCGPAPTQGLCPFLPRCGAALPGLCDRVPAPVREGDGMRWLCHLPPIPSSALPIKEPA
jgi:peptide/nickel transport system ATP-binding protein